MNIGIVFVVILLITIMMLKCIFNFSLKIFSLCLLILTVVLTVWICSVQPKLHKPLSLNTIEYLLKINKDGSMTTTRQITQTVYQQEAGR